MKVLHLNTKDLIGGAARAMHRLHEGLSELGVGSEILVQNRRSDDPDVFSPYRGPAARFYAERRSYLNALLQKLQRTPNPILHSFNVLPSGMHRVVNRSDADIVHLHWINAEMISIREIAKIDKLLVWTLHDMWAFCGAEHAVDHRTERRFREGYTAANRPKTHTGLDLDRWTWQRKRRHWKEGGAGIHFVSPSRWLASCLEESALFGKSPVEVVPHGLDTERFKPWEAGRAREELDLPPDKKIILYGAVNATTHPLKGYGKLQEARSLLEKREEIGEICFVVFGGDEPSRRGEEEGPLTIQMGTVRDDRRLAALYSAADVMVVPSLMESFGQTVSEAMACGTPVVAFDTTGPAENIDHKRDGWLAPRFDTEDLARGVAFVLAEEGRPAEMGRRAREKAMERFDIRRTAGRYLEVYEKRLESAR